MFTTKRILTAYAETVEDETVRTNLIERIDVIEYVPNTTVCTAIAAQTAFTRALAGYLLVDFEHRVFEFTTDSDIEEIRKAIPRA